jgi:hypothetical protein
MPSVEEEGPKPGDDAADDLTLGTNPDGGLLPGSEPTPVAPTAKDSGAIFNEHGLRIFKKRKDGMQLEAISLLGPNKLAKALLKGGDQAAQALGEIHRRQHHLPTAGLRKLLRLGNYPEPLMDLAKEVVDACPICRTWEELPTRPTVSVDIAEEVNGVVWTDLVFWHAGVEDWIEVIVMKFVDEASSFTRNPRLQNRTFPQLRSGVYTWAEILGFMRKLRMDQESAANSENMKAFLEDNQSLLDLLPKHVKHTRTGFLDSRIRIFRRTANRIDASFRRIGVPATADDVLRLTTWAENSTSVAGGVSPSMIALGHVPRDELDLGALTTSQVEGPQFLNRLRMRNISLSAHQQETAREKIAAIGRAHAIRDSSEEFGLNDMVDVYRTMHNEI